MGQVVYFSYTGFRSSKLDNLKRPLLMQGEWLKLECMVTLNQGPERKQGNNQVCLSQASSQVSIVLCSIPK